MASKKLVALRLDLEQIAGLEHVKRQTGAPVAEQVRRAIDRWLAANGVKVKSAKKGRTR